jgi:hypothetical protein
MGKVLDFNIKQLRKEDNKLKSYPERNFYKHKKVIRGNGYKMKSAVLIV